MKRILFIILFFSVLLAGYSQRSRRNFRQHEIGVFLGGSYYLGDLNPRKHFFLMKPAGGLFYRFTPNYRYAFRGGINFGSVMGDDSQSEDADQRKRNLNFKSRINELYAQAEFNFVEYRISNNKYKFSFFIFAGVSLFNFNPQGNLGGGTWNNLRPLRTEGQTKKYKLWQMAVPFGIGYKLNVSNWIGLGLEWAPRKTFTDYLDDVSGTYPDYSKNPPTSDLAMAYSNKSTDGGDKTNSQRGNPRTKDWYSFFGLTLNIKVVFRPQPCYQSGMD